jgi:hypothetical protein
MARRGEVASLTVVVGRVLALLKNWDLVEPGPARASYSAKASSIPAATLEIQTWLLACALTAHPAHELPIPDLISLPELFPFSINPGSADIRASKWFEVNRYGAGWEMVKLRPALSPSPD